MIKRRYLVIYLALICCSHSKHAEAQDSLTEQLPAVWDLTQCLDYAKKNNYEINTLRFDKRSSEQDLYLAKAALYPNLFGNLSQSYTHSKNANPVVGGFQTQSSVAGAYSLTSSVIVYQGGFLKNDIREKDLLIQSASLNIIQSQNDLTLQVTQAFLNILLAKENIVYIEDLLKTSRAQTDRGQQQFNAGSIARKDLAELQAQQANDKYNLVTAQNTERQNRLALKQLLLLPSSTPFDILTPDTIIANALVPSLGEVQKTAFQNRPEIKNAALGIEIQEVNLAKARAGYLPVLSVGGTLSTGYSNNQSVGYLKQLDNNFFQRLGITVSIPIFNNRVTKTNIEKTKINIDQAHLDAKNTKTVLSQQIEQAYINVLNAQGQYDAAAEQLTATQESYRIANEQLKVGVANTVEFLQQKNLYIQALQNYIQAKYNSALNIKIYEFYSGLPIKL